MGQRRRSGPEKRSLFTTLSAIHKTSRLLSEIQGILKASASFPWNGWENDILMEIGQKYYLDGPRLRE